jgi:hypothetical protein
VEVAIGLVLVILGVAGAAAAQRTAEEHGLGWRTPLLVAPMGLLIGAGAALARGWHLAGTMLAGLVALPLVTIGAQLVRERRAAGRDR